MLVLVNCSVRLSRFLARPALQLECGVALALPLALLHTLLCLECDMIEEQHWKHTHTHTRRAQRRYRGIRRGGGSRSSSRSINGNSESIPAVIVTVRASRRKWQPLTHNVYHCRLPYTGGAQIAVSKFTMALRVVYNRVYTRRADGKRVAHGRQQWRQPSRHSKARPHKKIRMQCFVQYVCMFFGG